MHHPSVDFAAISHDCRPRLSTRAARPLARAKPFEFPADTFSFSNALYFDYQVKPGGGLKIQKRATGKVPDYSRHCFTLVRAVLQFYKYAEFRPTCRGFRTKNTASGFFNLAGSLSGVLDQKKRFSFLVTLTSTAFRPIIP